MVQQLVYMELLYSVPFSSPGSCLEFAFAVFLGYASIGPCASIAENFGCVTAFLEVYAFFDSFALPIEFFVFETSLFCVALAAVNSFNLFAVYSSLAHNWVIFFVVTFVTIANRN